jgi:hypothetical protein
MASSTENVLRKPRGRPATGQDPVTAIRLSPELRAAVDQWRETRPDPKPSRSEAIRWLVETGLAQGDSLSRLYRDTLQTSLERAEQDPADEVERGWAALYRDLIAKVPSADELQEWFVHAINDRVERLAHDRERAEKKRGRKPT